MVGEMGLVKWKEPIHIVVKRRLSYEKEWRERNIFTLLTWGKESVFTEMGREESFIWWGED